MSDQRADVGAEPQGDPIDQGRDTTGFRAFLLADIRGYSSFSDARGDEAAAALTERFIEIAGRVIGEFGGESLGNRGDEVLFAFQSPRQAIRAAVAFEQALLDATREDPSLPMPTGVGIDVGEAVVVSDGWRANAINVAARLCSLARGGEILATREAVHLAQAIDGISYTPRGATQVKGIAQPVNLVRVAPEGGDTVREFAQLGFARAQAPPPRKRSGRRVLVAGVAAVAIVAVGLAVLLGLGGSSNVRLAADEVGAIDTSSGQVISAIPVSAQPSSVAVGRDGSIWVVSAAAGTLSRIDPKTHDITQITVGSDPVAVAVTPDGSSVWVANSGDGTVSRVSPENNQVVGSPVRVGAGPSALVATNNAVWVANTLNASVSRISLPSENAKTIPVGSEPAGIAAGDGSIWVANEGDGTVDQLSQSDGSEIQSIGVGKGPTGVAFGNGAAWVANSIAGSLSRIDAQTNNVTTIPVGAGPYDVAVGPGGVWVSDEYGNAIAQVDPVKLTVSQTTKTSSAPLGLALAGDRLWVAADGNGAAAHRGGVLDVLASSIDGPYPGDPPTIDPATNGFVHPERVLAITSDGLVGYRRERGVAGSELVPDLAVALPAPTDNGLTYTFHIRSGIRYSNGMSLRASDFRRGLQRAFNPNDPVSSDFGLIVGAQRCLQDPKACDLSRGIVADDATGTVTVHLTQPDPDLFAQLALQAAYPVPPGPWMHAPTRTIPGTGPYEISLYRPDLSDKPHTHGTLVLKRNPHFREWSAAAQPEGFPNEIVIRTNYTASQQLGAVEQGKADLMWDPPTPGQITSVSQNLPSQLHENPQPVTFYLWLNARSAPFDNLRARQAFNYAVDRAALARFHAHGTNGEGAVPTCQLLPPDFPGYVRYCPYGHDVLKARELVQQSGTYGAPVTLLETSDLPVRLGQVVIASLRAIGYRARLTYLPPDKAFSGPPQNFYLRYQAGFVGWYADYVSAAEVIASTVQCSDIAQGANWGHFCDHNLDAKIATALGQETSNPGLASQDWTAIDHKIVDMAVEVPLNNRLTTDFLARRVGDYQYNPQWGPLLDQLWVR
jgi:peptide/nickel transport system substrate-binding protein